MLAGNVVGGIKLVSAQEITADIKGYIILESCINTLLGRSCQKRMGSSFFVGPNKS